mmetsp:Transcript_115938/g.289586  ORF Transcript_115938/g.289586 Transcript_115938/m.289586 type:complete len:375 (+) Transcript_115938:57-1181(+)
MMRSLGLALLPLAWGCSYVEIPFPTGKNGTSYMIARTMELGNLAGRTSHNVEVVPAHIAGGKHGYVAPMSTLHLPGIQIKIPCEGMNDAGLTVSALVLSESVYEERQEGMPAVKAEDVIPELLTHCDSVASALDFLASVRVVLSPLTMVLSAHWAITDASGQSVVVEYLQGQRKVSQNTPRVLTNDPNLQWHWRNLNTYSNLSPYYPNQNSFLEVETDHDVGRVPRPVGHGWNLHGLPGDTSAVSRFVRLFYLRGYALHASSMKDESDAIVLGTALLNNVFIPYGVAATDPAMGPGIDRPEYTPYAILKSPAERKMLIRGYRNTQWRLIDMSKLDLTQAQAWPIEDGSLGIADITTEGSVMTGVGSDDVAIAVV